MGGVCDPRTAGERRDDADNRALAITLAGSQKWLFGTGELDAFATNGPRIRNITGTNTTPSLNPRKGDPDTGIGGSADEVSIIAGGEEFQKVNDPGDTASGEVIRFAGPNRAGR